MGGFRISGETILGKEVAICCSQPHVTLVELLLNFVCVTHGNFMCTSTLQSFKASCRYLLGPIFIYERALFPFGP